MLIDGRDGVNLFFLQFLPATMLLHAYLHAHLLIYVLYAILDTLYSSMDWNRRDGYCVCFCISEFLPFFF